MHYAGGAPVCAIAHGCETVQKSDYAKLAGRPGRAARRASATSASSPSLIRDDENSRTVAAFLSIVGLGFSAWLTYIEVALTQRDLHLVRRLGDLHDDPGRR